MGEGLAQHLGAWLERELGDAASPTLLTWEILSADLILSDRATGIDSQQMLHFEKPGDPWTGTYMPLGLTLWLLPPRTSDPFHCHPAGVNPLEFFLAGQPSLRYSLSSGTDGITVPA